MTTDVELAISGMTCASCANRIERKLNKLDGVAATVNYATEKAKVTYPGDGHARRAGRAPSSRPATAPRCRARPTDAGAARPPRTRPTRCAQRLLVVARAHACPVVALAMVPALQFDYWQWLSLTLAAPVVVWGGLAVPPGRLGQPAPRRRHHGHAGLARHAGRVRLVALRAVLGTAGEPGMTHPFELTIERTDGAGNIYLEAAAGVTTFILAGRYFEARSKRRAGAALRALLELGRQGRRGAPRRRARCGSRSSELAVGDAVRRPPRREDRHRRRRRAGHLGRRRRRCSPASPCRSRSVPATPVVGATVNAGGRLVVRATRVGADTQLAQMARLVEDAQNGKAEVQRLADRVSGVFVPDRDRASPSATLGFWLGAGAGASRGVHRRGRGADHRLPVRPRAGHADRADGRHRPRRPARHPDQGPRGAGVHPPRRHRRARQDRHRHHRRDDRCVDVVAADGRGRRRGAAAGRRRRGRLRAPDRPGRRRRRARAARRPARRSTDFANAEGRATASSGRRRVGARRSTRRRGPPGERRARRARARRPSSRSAGTAPPAGWLVGRRRGQADLRRGRRRLRDARAAPGAADRRQRARSPARSPPRSASTTPT